MGSPEEIFQEYGKKMMTNKQFDAMFDIVLDQTLEHLKSFPTRLDASLFIIEEAKDEEIKTNKVPIRMMVLERELEQDWIRESEPFRTCESAAAECGGNAEL